MGRKPKFNCEQLRELNKEYDAGAKSKDLAIKHNVSTQTIERYIWNPRQVMERRGE